MAETLTTNLSIELEKTSQELARWSEEQRSWLSSCDHSYERCIEEYETTIFALREADRELDLKHEELLLEREKQLREEQKIRRENDLLLQNKQSLLAQLRSCEEEEEKEMLRLSDIRKEHESLRSKMEQSLNDLTHGLKQFLSLGLEFQKAEGEMMKFIFTQIDPSSPSRVFFFLMFVDQDNLYQLVETCPPVDPMQCSNILEDLNNDNEIGIFVFRIRKLFCHFAIGKN